MGKITVEVDERDLTSFNFWQFQRSNYWSRRERRRPAPKPTHHKCCMCGKKFTTTGADIEGRLRASWKCCSAGCRAALSLVRARKTMDQK